MQNSLQQSIKKITSILDSLNINYHLTGGLVSSFYGEPRFTQDVDFVIIFPDNLIVDKLIAKLKNEYFFDEEAIKDAIVRKSLFQVLDEEQMIKIDFHVGEAIEGELSRSKKVEILPNLSIPIVSKEDAILSKIIWVQKGSHKSRRDIKGMLFDKSNVDFEYLNNKLDELKLNEFFNSIISSND